MSGDYRKEVRAAWEIHRRRDMFDEQSTRKAVAELAEHGIWSKRQIAAISGAKASVVNALVHKSDRTGGRLNPATLELILEAFHNKDARERNPFLWLRIITEGTSVYVLAFLLGIPVSTVKYQVARVSA